MRLTKQNEALYQRLHRRDKKIKNMKDLLQSLKDKQLILDEQLQNLNQNFGHVAQHLFENYAKNVKKSNPHASRYSKETKQFAMTLHYYSPKGYDFVQTILNLPHPSSIHTWAASVDCKPGYLMNVIHCLGEQVKKNSWMSDVALIVDAMALHKMTVWDDASKCYVGLVDYGTAMPEPETTEATEALVFMVVGLTGHWKHPIAYVLQDKCSADVQMQLIKDCIVLLHDEDMQVHAVVFDGTFTNQCTAIKLGCKMTVSERQTWFPHPERPSSKVHMLCLIYVT